MVLRISSALIFSSPMRAMVFGSAASKLVLSTEAETLSPAVGEFKPLPVVIMAGVAEAEGSVVAVTFASAAHALPARSDRT